MLGIVTITIDPVEVLVWALIGLVVGFRHPGDAGSRPGGGRLTSSSAWWARWRGTSSPSCSG